MHSAPPSWPGTVAAVVRRWQRETDSDVRQWQMLGRPQARGQGGMATLYLVCASIAKPRHCVRSDQPKWQKRM
jgi:hypothetical protein